jgi:chaperone modulatory protein CbpM
MMDIIAIAALFPDLTQVEVISWVERGWVSPDTNEGGLVFRDIDVARVRLIRDLRQSMDVAEDAMPLVLSLLDQVYELRSRLKSVLRAVETQPRDVQRAVLAAIEPSVDYDRGAAGV